MLPKLRYSREAASELQGLSPQGRDFLETELLKAFTVNPTEKHIHAGGMCVLVEASGDAVEVKAASPACLVRKS